MNRGGENIQKKEFIRQINELVPRPDPVTTEALFQISSACPAVAAHITCNADLGITEVAYYPLWLERSQSQAPMQPQM